MHGQMENGGLVSVNDLTTAPLTRPPDDYNSLSATLQRGLEHIFNAVYSDSDKSDAGDSGSDSEADNSWSEDAC